MNERKRAASAIAKVTNDERGDSLGASHAPLHDERHGYRKSADSNQNTPQVFLQKNFQKNKGTEI